MAKNAYTSGPQPLLELGTPKSPSTALRDLYKKERDFAFQTFDPETHPEVLSIPETPQQFLQQFEESRELHRILVHEMLTGISGFGRNGYKVHGRTLHDHQRAHLFWDATTLGSGKKAPSSLLNRGAPGTGKTLELGQWMQAGIHAQLRGILPKGIIAYLTQRPFHLVQQTRGLGMARQRLVRTPPFTLTEREVTAMFKEFRKLHPDLAGMLKQDGWEELFDEHPATEADARSAVQRLLHRHGKLEKARVLPDFEKKEQALMKLLLGSATTVQGINHEPVMVDLPEIDRKSDVHTAFGGDAAFGIPADYPVLAKERWGMQANEKIEKPRILLMPAIGLTSTVQREKLARILKDVVLVLCDEGGSMHPEVFENPVTESGGKKPVVIAATATDLGRKWAARSPEHDVGESVEAGVLPDVGIDIFPGKDDLHYPRDSMQAMKQLVDHHFADLELLKRLKLPQPKEGNSLIVVHGKATRACAEALQKRYDKEGHGGQVFCMDGRTPQPDREKLLLWMAGEGSGPKVLVGNPTSLATALDLPHVHNVTIGTTITPVLLKQILGRALHSTHDRVICRQQQFSDSNLSTTPFAQLEHGAALPEDEGFRWVPGQALMSQKALKKDRKKAAEKPAIQGTEVPPPATSPKKNDQVIAVGQGTDASDFLKPEVAKVLDALCRTPSRALLGELQSVLNTSGCLELSSVMAMYSGSLSLFLERNASDPDFRLLLCTKLIDMRDKARARNSQ